ncbi:gp86 [Sphingomonas phage PAU]|uniref:gp86 n=1 Tax=Sphingomonas phage PAU TaxID=1150991 RepID=UPI00025731E0|nr:gp86 [Sphingomonas phage PAU]AFF28084.1 gp86 [Sphingomonas phage PAU]
MEIIHKIGFFEFLDAFFTDSVTYKRLTVKAKMEHYFMTIRTLSIMLPSYCHIINKTHNVHVLDSIQKEVGNQSRKPQWLFTSSKGIKAAEEQANPLAKYQEADLIEFCKDNELEFKDLKTIHQFAGKNLIASIESYIDDLLSDKMKPTKSRKN